MSRASRLPTLPYILSLAVGGALVASACAPDAGAPNGSGSQQDDSTAAEAAEGSGGDGTGDLGGGDLGGDDLGGLSLGDAGGSRDNQGEACAATSAKGEQIVDEVPVTVEIRSRVDLFIMFDQSLSMDCGVPGGGSRWSVVKGALQSFLEADGAAGLGVGIQYFGQPVPGSLAGWIPFYGDLDSSCDPADYANPHVPIDVLPGNTPALVASLDAHQPRTNTPTRAALEGAIMHATAWSSTVDHDVVVVLVTDGQPNACGSVADVVQVAANGLAAGIPTYVIGVISPGSSCAFDPNPPNVPDLDAVAEAGGTGEALIVNAEDNPSVQFLARMNQIRDSITVTETRTEIRAVPVPCEWEIPEPPEGETFDEEKVNVQFSAEGGAPQSIGRVDAEADCASTGGGWFYDDPDAPSSVHVCPATCGAIQATTNTQIDILFGCETVFAVPR